MRGAVMSAQGEVREFHRKGVIDLFTLVTAEPDFLQGGKIADRVIGRGAALLLIKGGIKEVFAYVISEPALEVLHANNIIVNYISLQLNIINRTGDGICPVEKLTADIDSPEEAYKKIKEFLKI